MREPLPIMPRTVSVSVVQVRLSPTSVSNGSRYWVNGSFHSNSHFMATAPKRSTNAAMILPQPGKRDYEWMSIDHLDSALLVLAGPERQRTGALERGELVGVNAPLERFANLLPGVGRLGREVGLAHQEGRAVV